MIELEKIKETVKNYESELLKNEDLITVGLFSNKNQIKYFNKITKFSDKYKYVKLHRAPFYRKKDILEMLEDKQIVQTYIKYQENINKKQKQKQQVKQVANPVTTIDQLLNDFKQFLVGKYVHGHNA